MTLPIKPEVCILGGNLAVFLGADYKLMPLAVAETFVANLQRGLEALRRQQETQRERTSPGEQRRGGARALYQRHHQRGRRQRRHQPRRDRRLHRVAQCGADRSDVEVAEAGARERRGMERSRDEGGQAVGHAESVT